MALRVWLPLTGSLENKGISEEVIVTTTPVYVDNGKIGKAMSTGSAKISAATAASILNNQEFSFCCWIYVNASAGDTTNRAMLFGNGGMTAPNNRKFSIFQYPSCNDLHLSWQNDVTNATFAGGVWSGVFPSYTWTHLAITYKNPNGKIYINGNHYANFSGTSDSASFNFETILFSNIPNAARYLNDYRVYDHCLSAAEVKEISQGLVLHYKLDSFQGGLGNPNLYTGSRDFSGSWGNGSNWTTATETYKGFTVKQRSATWAGLHQNITCAQNDIFTISFYAKVESGGTIKTIHRSNLGNVTTGLSIIGGNIKSGKDWIRTSDDGTQWGYYWATVKIVSADITYLQWRLENSVNGKNMCICGIKLEKGSSATGWSPAASEGSFNTIQDSSGYGHNGTITGTPTLNSNTPRYSACLNLTSGQKISASGLLTTPNPILTINFWVKTYSNTYTAWADVITFNGNKPIRVEVNNANGKNIAWYNYPLGTSSGIPISNVNYDEWNMVTLVWNGTSILSYFNGILKYTATISGTEWTPNGVMTLGDNGMYMYISDVRVYCTALSAADILSLYNTAAKVDNLGNWHTFEFKENNGIAKITKMGITEANEVYDNMNFNNRAQIVKNNAKVLIAGDLNIVTTYSSSTKTGTIASLPAATVQSLTGKTLRFIYDVSAPGARYSAEQGQTAWSYTRYGIHGYCTMDGSTSYPFAGQLNYTGDGIHAIQTWTIPTGKSTYGDLGFSIQNFDKPSSTNNATWFIRNVRLEVVEGTSDDITGTTLIEK